MLIKTKIFLSLSSDLNQFFVAAVVGGGALDVAVVAAVVADVAVVVAAADVVDALDAAVDAVVVVVADGVWPLC